MQEPVLCCICKRQMSDQQEARVVMVEGVMPTCGKCVKNQFEVWIRKQRKEEHYA